jgi:hypothetical protein
MSEARAVDGSKVNGSQYVCVYNKTSEKFIATRARVADSYLSRLVGLLGTTRSWARPGNGLWIVPSQGIHTVGMLYALDLIFLDSDKTVIDVQEHVRPFRISKVSLKASSVLELPTHTVFRTETKVGDKLEFSPVRNLEPGR